MSYTLRESAANFSRYALESIAPNIRESLRPFLNGSSAGRANFRSLIKEMKDTRRPFSIVYIRGKEYNPNSDNVTQIITQLFALGIGIIEEVSTVDYGVRREGVFDLSKGELKGTVVAHNQFGFVVYERTSKEDTYLSDNGEPYSYITMRIFIYEN